MRLVVGPEAGTKVSFFADAVEQFSLVDQVFDHDVDDSAGGDLFCNCSKLQILGALLTRIR